MTKEEQVWLTVYLAFISSVKIDVVCISHTAARIADESVHAFNARFPKENYGNNT